MQVLTIMVPHCGNTKTNSKTAILDRWYHFTIRLDWVGFEQADFESREILQ
jgi:hypothetical protein